MDAQLSLYESMSQISAAMCKAAQANDWDQLCELESEVTRLRKRLQQEPTAPTQDEDCRQQKISLIHKILADDREIRSHAEPWMEGVRALLAGGARQRALNNAYGVSRS